MSELVIDGKRWVAGPELAEWPEEMPDGSVWCWKSDGWYDLEWDSACRVMRAMDDALTGSADGKWSPLTRWNEDIFHNGDTIRRLYPVPDIQPPSGWEFAGEWQAMPPDRDDVMWIGVALDTEIMQKALTAAAIRGVWVNGDICAPLRRVDSDHSPDAGKMASMPEPPPKDKGEAVTPKLIRWLVEHVDGRDDDWDFYDAIQLVRQRHAYGLAKYGQPLKTGDGRDTIEDARQEAGDLLQYLWKGRMQGLDLSQFRGLLRVALAIVEGEG